MRTRIKMCGLSDERAIDTAVSIGVDAVGFIHYPPSVRNIEFERAAVLRQRLPAFVDAVSVVVDAQPALIDTLLEVVQPDYLQFHGNESPQQCERYGVKYIRAIRVPSNPQGRTLIERTLEHYQNAHAILLDAQFENEYGGSGHQFDWSLIPTTARNKIILAGGLDADNVHSAIVNYAPFAVDVSSGIEAQKGVKDLDKMHKFAATVAAANAVNARKSPQN